MVVKGTETIDKIKKVVTTRQSYMSDVPVNTIIIQSATLIK
jgi:cyclophilin family peptidyl-prolyl cis-trans isomerase